MRAGAEILADHAALAADEGSAQAEAGSAQVDRRRTDAGREETWQSIGVLAAELMEQIKDRATRTAPREMVRAPAGEVAIAGRSRNSR